MPLIGLRGGYNAKIDSIDWPLVSQYLWHISSNGYAMTVIHDPEKYKATGNGNKNIFMHKLIMGSPPKEGLICDHKDGDRTNNKRSNLRWATHKQNSWNSRSCAKSGYKGVNQDGNRWVASCNRLCVGRFDTAEEAAMAHDKAARHFHGEFAYLNFPDKFYEGELRYVDFIPDQKKPVSDYPGVTYFGHGGKRVKRWRAVYRKKTIGYFHTELIAYLAYRSAKNIEQCSE
ncbi:AP2/ERF family transcription factor [Cellvibrio mixtus]|uniref:AP2/ERF family transcription factor n=1 Tax=Cellvibrio mixtus TaxID=39650 RepID=UPI00069388F2|nr:AP2/ERF family transcription factor [Cellvibrio mixtus]